MVLPAVFLPRGTAGGINSPDAEFPARGRYHAFPFDFMLWQDRFETCTYRWCGFAPATTIWNPVRKAYRRISALCTGKAFFVCFAVTAATMVVGL